MKCADYMVFCSSHSFIFFGSTFYHCIYGCMFCMLLFYFVNYVFFYVYVFLLLYMFCSVYSVSLCCSVLFVCKCVLYYCHRLSTQLQITKYINISSNTGLSILLI